MTKTGNTTEQELRRQLKAYFSHAQLNEQKMRRMQAQELRFISARDVVELLDAILIDYPEFYQLSSLSLLLLDSDYEIRRILERLSIETSRYPQLHFIETTEKIEPFLNAYLQPCLGSYSEVTHGFLFRHLSRKPASIAILPLQRADKIIGTVNMASSDDSRFIQGSATDLLQRLAAILAVCIENAMNMEKLKLLGLLDPLTGIYNRRYFDERTIEELNRAARHRSPVSCLFIDIDHFKQFNDCYGHSVGDLVLQSVAQVIRFQMRKSDVLCRYGGEEFAALLTDTPKQTAMEIAERIRLLVEQRSIELAAAEEALQVTVSIGCSTLLNISNNIEANLSGLLSSADKALYTSKETGRNRVSFQDCLPATGA